MSMLPRISIGLIIVVAVVYIIGAKYPGLAQRIGFA